MLKFLRGAVAVADKTIIKATRALSLKLRLILLVFIMSIAPIGLIGVTAYKKADADIVNKTSLSSLQIVRQMSLTINAKLSSWKQYGDIIAVSEDAQSILKNYDGMDDANKYLSSKKLVRIMKEALKVTLDIQEPVLMSNGGGVISMSDSSSFINNIAGADEIKKNTKDADGRYVWFTDDVAKKEYKGLIVLSRGIKDLGTFNDTIGSLFLRVDSNYLYNLYNNANLGTGSKVYLLDSKYMVVLSGDKNEVGSRFTDSTSRSIDKIYKTGSTSGTIKNVEGGYLAAFSVVPESGWTVVALIPNEYMNSLSNDIKHIVIQVVLICILISILIFMVVYRSITFPLWELIRSMRDLKKGSLKSGKLLDDSRDEVAEVTASYNLMIDELNQQIENIKAKEQQRTLAEFKALQAQINPHFIANTLNNVAWMAKMQKADNIESVVTSMIKLLNSSMGRGPDIITIEEEIENIKSYINIQEYKYIKKIGVNIDFDAEILKYKILKFILQPIVENSMIHGLGPKQGQGFITIKGYADDGDISIIVEDNGVGMTQNEMDLLLKGEENGSRERFSSIGLRNVNERIRLAYGEKYGLHIKSQKDVFTSVEIRIPIII
ncbi:sensor histidine kinase [Ruminiclostridium cellobioparum]|uniref:Integral membrane sensor signal transduction histidine kinase n=2 Tax=Ruminiclostridium cellobioparum TaxID=29355 RepID=S0FJ41_RUMCE|nr:sensor histidine kinase [Ruminiclostridium cellobioparum]EMS70251.1 integral membrane sensor signal transduction histidine kinase [Ruminiclostridium cellobioparum subsp. termitidis CT1112]